MNLTRYNKISFSVPSGLFYRFRMMTSLLNNPSSRKLSQNCFYQIFFVNILRTAAESFITKHSTLSQFQIITKPRMRCHESELKNMISNDGKQVIIAILKRGKSTHVDITQYHLPLNSSNSSHSHENSFLTNLSAYAMTIRRI